MKIFASLIGLTLMAAPLSAAAHCGQMSSKGSFSASCENGVTVIRGVPRANPALPSLAQAKIRQAELQRETAREKIQAKRAIAARRAELKDRELAQERYEADRAARRSSRYGYGYSLPNYGASIGFPAPRRRGPARRH